MAQTVKNRLASAGDVATHSSIPAWGLPWTEKPGRLQHQGSPRPDTTERQSNDNCQLSADVASACCDTEVGGPLSELEFLGVGRRS